MSSGLTRRYAGLSIQRPHLLALRRLAIAFGAALIFCIDIALAASQNVSRDPFQVGDWIGRAFSTPARAPVPDSKEIVRFSAWKAQVNDVGKLLFKVVALVDQIDEISQSYVEKSVTRDFARRNAARLFARLQHSFTEASDRVDRLPAPPRSANDGIRASGTSIARYIRGLRGHVRQMIADTKSAFQAAMTGDHSAIADFTIRSLDRRIVLIQSENVLIRTQRLISSRINAQTLLNDSVLYANEAMLQILSYTREMLKGDTIADQRLARELFDGSLVKMIAAIESGEDLVDEHQRAVTKLRSMSRETGRLVSALWENYRRSFEVERDLARHLETYGDTVFDPNTASLGVDADRILESLNIEFDLSVDQRSELTAERFALIKKFRPR